MAKSIRSIKNTLCDDEKLGALSRDARLLFIGLITRADDHGRFRSHAAVVRGQVFPYDDDLSIADVERLLQGLASAGRIQLYDHEGQRYGSIPTWARHQRVDNASQSELPDPPAANCGELRLGSEAENPSTEHASGDDGPVDNSSRSVVNHDQMVDATSMPQTAANCGEPPLDRRGEDRKGTIAEDKPRRQTDALFEAVCGACGIDRDSLTKSGRGAVNKALAELRAAGATPADVPARAKRWRYQTPLTAPALAKHWASLGPPAAQHPAVGPRVFTAPPPATDEDRAAGAAALAAVRDITRGRNNGATQ
jgi:hypothetical protein